MILTCPECSTKYVVKDGAIPAGGRQVRCAACKHSWHQDPEAVPPIEALDEGEPGPFAAPADPVEAPPESEPATEYEVPAAPSAAAATTDEERWQEVETGPEWSEPVAEAPVEFEPFFQEVEAEPPRRAWKIVLAILVLAALAAVAFWYLAPSNLKSRVGLADGGSTPLQVMGLSQARQRLASGNDLFTVSGRIVNPTDSSQPVPPLQAELLADNKQTVIYRWTIAPPADTLGANDSRMFHSAEMGVPEGGRYLRLRLVRAGG